MISKLLMFLGLMMVFSAVSHAQPTDAAPAAVSAPAASGAPATAPAEPERDTASTADQVVRDVRAGNWRYALAGLLFLAMAGLSKVRDKVKWFKGDRGGAVLVMLLALGGALSTSLFSTEPLTPKLFIGAVGVAWMAVGGFTWFKRLIWPADLKPA